MGAKSEATDFQYIDIWQQLLKVLQGIPHWQLTYSIIKGFHTMPLKENYFEN